MHRPVLMEFDFTVADSTVPIAGPGGRRFEPGQRVGNLEILERLGSGSFGTVFRAVDVRLGRHVAVKAITRDLPDDDGRFHREARALAAISHPNVVTVFDVGEVDGRPFIVMELLRGRTLRARLEEGPPSLAEALLWIRDLLRGLSAVHQAGLVHLDLKPENLFVTDDARLKVLDFGVARVMRDDGDARRFIAGTISYMAPEQLAGEHVDARTDLFAVGILLHELLVKRHPFVRPTSEATAEAIRSAPPLASVGAMWANPGLAEIVDGCLAKDPALRPRSAAELLDKLRPYVEAEAGGVITEVGHLEVDQGQLAYRTFGQGTKDVLLIPGMLSHIDMWTHGTEGLGLMRALCAGYRVVVPDRCGRGASDRLPDVVQLSVEDELEHLIAVMEATAARRPVVVATDEGCTLALALGALFGDRISGVVLIDPLRFANGVARDHRLDAWGTPDAAQAVLGDAVVPAHVRAWLVSWERMTGPRQVARAALDRLAGLDLAALLPRVAAPTWIVGGADDGDDEALRALASAMEPAQVVTVPGTTRFLPLVDAAGLVSVLGRATAAAARSPRTCFIAIDQPRSVLPVRARGLAVAEQDGWTLLHAALPARGVRLVRSIVEAEGQHERPRAVALLAANETGAWAALERVPRPAAGELVLGADVSALLAGLIAGASDDESEVEPGELSAVAQFEHRSFRIETHGPLTLRFIGSLAMRDPSQILLPQLRSIHAAARGCGRLVIDVTLLRHVNSTALGALIQWAGWIREEPTDQRYRLVIVTDRMVLWQRSSLPALCMLAPDVLELQ